MYYDFDASKIQLRMENEGKAITLVSELKEAVILQKITVRREELDDTVTIYDSSESMCYLISPNFDHLQDYADLHNTIEKVLNSTHGVVEPDLNDIRMFFRGGGELQIHRCTPGDDLEQWVTQQGEKIKLLLVSELRAREDVKNLLRQTNTPNVACFVPAIYINDSCEESVTIIILKQL